MRLLRESTIFLTNMDIIIKPTNQYTDDRGSISMLIEDAQFSSVSFITSKAGAKRANHIHFDDYHYCVLTLGKMNYYERPAYSQEKPTLVVINAGEIFYTKPKTEHLMEFLEDSCFWCFSKNNRKQATYEADTIRLPFDLAEVYKKMS